MRIGLPLLAFVGATALLVSPARADVKHVVARGHTVEAIANRYRVPAKAIIAANQLKDPRRLKVGSVLTIPNTAQGKKGGRPDKGTSGDGGKKLAKNGKPDPGARTYAAKPKTPGVVHLRRAGTKERAKLRITGKNGKVPASTLKSLEKMLRASSGATHPVAARLVSLLGLVSNHFGSRPIEIVSGFRPHTPSPSGKHSHHNRGRAIDFRVVGVPNEAVRDFCRTLKNVGCGYYPNSTFVHMDVRESPAFWVDYSRPGEPPRYDVDAEPGEASDLERPEQATSNTPPPPATADDAVPGSKHEEGEDDGTAGGAAYFFFDAAGFGAGGSTGFIASNRKPRGKSGLLIAYRVVSS